MFMLLGADGCNANDRENLQSVNYHSPTLHSICDKIIWVEISIYMSICDYKSNTFL